MSPLPQRGEQGGRGGAQMSREGKMVEDSGTAASPRSVSASTTQEENKTRKKKRKFLCIGWPPWMKRKKKCVSTQHREGGEKKDQTGKSKKVEEGEESHARGYQLLDHLHKLPEDSTMGENSLDLKSSSVWQNLAKVGKVIGLGKTTPLNDFDSRRDAESSLRNGSSFRTERHHDDKSLHRKKFISRVDFPSSGASNEESSKTYRKKWRDRFPCCRKSRRSNKSSSNKEQMPPQADKSEGKSKPKRSMSNGSMSKGSKSNRRSKSRRKDKPPGQIKPLSVNDRSLKEKSNGWDNLLARGTSRKSKRNLEAMDLQQVVTPTPSYYSDIKSGPGQIGNREVGNENKKGRGINFGFCVFFCLLLATVVFFGVKYALPIDDDISIFAPQPYEIVRVEVISTVLLWICTCCILCCVKARIHTMSELLVALIFVLFNLSIVSVTRHCMEYVGKLKYFEGPLWLVSLIIPMLIVAFSCCCMTLAKLH